MTLEYSFTTYIKTNSKWNKDLSVRLEIIKIYKKKFYKKTIKKENSQNTLRRKS